MKLNLDRIGSVDPDIYKETNILLIIIGDFMALIAFNILDNAVKYTNYGGSIKVIVEEWELFTKIDIKDTGIGIAEEEINKIFKRFYRCSEVSEIEGIGIGLYLANEIITKQGGYIKVKSDVKNGSNFSVFLEKTMK